MAKVPTASVDVNTFLAVSVESICPKVETPWEEAPVQG